MAPAVGLEDLDSDNWNRLQDIVERFEQACAQSFPQRIEDYLPAAGDAIRPAVLEELVRTDLELQWRNGRRALVEDYLRRFAELKNSGCVPSLLHDEYRVRHQFGDRPPLAEYQSRHQEYYSHFAELVNAFGSASAGEATPIGGAAPIGLAASIGLAAPRKGPPDDSIATMFAMGGQFKKIKRLGRGAFGEVWQAEAPGGVPIAIKRIFGTVSPQAIERERQSLDLICSGKLRHPFLLQVFGWWLQDGKLHIAMELADSSLDDKLKEAKRSGLCGVPPAELKQVFIDAADALDFLNHEKNILHRDVKPANMLLMAHRLKLCDFGLSRMTANLATGTGKTLGAGTPVFMAPEIISGYQSRHSDQYSLAASYCMLRTGKPIFRGKPAEVRQQHLGAAPQFDDDILGRAEQAVLLKALSKIPDDRFANCKQFVDELVAATTVAQAVRVVSGAASATPAQPTRIGVPGAAKPAAAANSALAGGNDDLSEPAPSAAPGLEHLTFDSSEDATDDSVWPSLPDPAASAPPSGSAGNRTGSSKADSSSKGAAVAKDSAGQSPPSSAAANSGDSGPADADSSDHDWAELSQSGRSSVIFPNEILPPPAARKSAETLPPDPSRQSDTKQRMVWQHLHRSGTMQRTNLGKSAPPAGEHPADTKKESRTLRESRTADDRRQTRDSSVQSALQETRPKKELHGASTNDAANGAMTFIWVIVFGILAAAAAIAINSFFGK